MSRITLHPEYGVNPSVEVCFWCGQAMGVVLLGRNKGKEAPREMVTGYTPCQTCQGHMDKGVTLVEVTFAHHAPNRPPIQGDLTPTGRWSVLTEEAVARVFKPETHASVMAAKKAFVDVEAYSNLIPNEDDPE